MVTPDDGVRSRKSASASKVLPQLGQFGRGAESSELRPPACETEKRVTWQMGQARSKVVEEKEEAVGVEGEEAVEVTAEAATAALPLRFDASSLAPTLAVSEAVTTLRVATEKERGHAGDLVGEGGRTEAEGGARASMLFRELMEKESMAWSKSRRERKRERERQRERRLRRCIIFFCLRRQK